MCEMIDGRCYNVRCRYHLLGEIQNGRIVYVHPSAMEAAKNKPFRKWSDDDLLAAVEALPETCAIDVANEGEHTAEYIGGLLGCSKQAVLQCEARMLRLLRIPIQRMMRDSEPEAPETQLMLTGLV